MTVVTNFFGTYGVKVLLSLIPIIVIAGYLIFMKTRSIREEQEINKRFAATKDTITQKNISQFIKKDTTKKGLFSKLQANMNVLGIESKYENASLFLIMLFVGAALASNLLIGAGPLLMAYFGALALATIYVIIMNKMDKKKRELREEFMEKLRDICAHMSVGLNFQTSITESLRATNTSIAMARELEKVRDAIYTGSKYSDAFMKMYENLGIKEIKEFAQICYVYEQTGGEFVKVIHSFEDSFKMKRKIMQENEVFESSMRSDQKIVIGIPVLCILGFAFMMPEVIRTFYQSFFGQILGIFLISIMYAGHLMMSRFMRMGGDD